MKHKSEINFILGIIKEEKKHIFIIMLYMFFIMILSYILPFATQKIIDNGFMNANVTSVIAYSCLSFIAYIALILVTILKDYKQSLMYNNVRRKLTSEAFEHLMRVRHSYFLEYSPTSIYQMLNEDIDTISSIFSDDSLMIFTGFFMAIGGGVALFSINWKLGFIALIFIPLKYVVTSVLSKKATAFAYKHLIISKEFSEYFSDIIKGIKEIRFFSLEDTKSKHIKEIQKQLLNIELNMSLYQNFNNQAEQLISQLIITIIYIISAFMLVKNSITIGGVIAFGTYVIMLAEPISGIINIVYGISMILPSVERYMVFSNVSEEKEEGYYLEIDGRIEISDLLFGYNDKPLIFEGVNIVIEKKQHIAIIGRNGVGKTTLLNIINRVIEPISGNLIIDATPANEINIKHYRKNISCLNQDFYLFNDSIINNICLNDCIDDEIIEYVISSLQLSDLIKEYGEKPIGDNGCFLSGGQRQKIALARTIIHKRPIMIFDEPHSNLDKEAIDGLTSLLDNYLRDTTVICVTHSLDFSNHFDMLYEITEFGDIIRRR